MVKECEGKKEAWGRGTCDYLAPNERLIENRFVPQYYKQELFLKMQTLRQGAFCVEGYVKEFEMLMIRCDLQEPQEQTIARFISGLHKEIVDAVELQPYVSFEDVIKLAMKIERQQRRSPTKVNKPFSSSSTLAYPFAESQNRNSRKKLRNQSWLT